MESMDDNRKKCAHRPCSCPVPDQSAYCSSQCRAADQNAAAEAAQPKCNCGHEHCSAGTVELADAEGLNMASSALAAR